MLVAMAIIVIKFANAYPHMNQVNYCRWPWIISNQICNAVATSRKWVTFKKLALRSLMTVNQLQTWHEFLSKLCCSRKQTNYILALQRKRLLWFLVSPLCKIQLLLWESTHLGFPATFHGVGVDNSGVKSITFSAGGKNILNLTFFVRKNWIMCTKGIHGQVLKSWIDTLNWPLINARWTP